MRVYSQSTSMDIEGFHKKYAIDIGVLKNSARLHFLIIGGESWDIRGLQAGTAPPSTPLSSQAFARRV